MYNQNHICATSSTQRLLCPSPHHQLGRGVHEDVLVSVHDRGPGLAVGQFELELGEQARHDHLNLADGEIPTGARLAAVSEGQAVRVRHTCRELGEVRVVPRVPPPVGTHRVKHLRVRRHPRVVGVVVTRERDSRSLRDFRAVLQLQWDQSDSLRVHLIEVLRLAVARVILLFLLQWRGLART